jgi:hypothetical protein
MWNERHVQILNAVKTKSGRSWPAGRLCIDALADRVCHARGRSPEGQEAEGRPCRMIFRSRNRRCRQGSTEHTSLRAVSETSGIAMPRAKKHPKLSADERAFLNRLDYLTEEEIKQLTTREIFAYFKIIDKVDSRADGR